MRVCPVATRPCRSHRPRRPGAPREGHYVRAAHDLGIEAEGRYPVALGFTDAVNPAPGSSDYQMLTDAWREVLAESAAA